MKANKLTFLSSLALIFLMGLLNQSCNSTKGLSNAVVTKVATADEVNALYQSIRTSNNVQLPPRIYNLDTPIMISGKSDFTLDGNGSTFIMERKSEDVLIVENCTNITLKNFKATHVEPDGPIGCTGSVVQVRYNDGVTVQGCQLNGSGIIGIVSYTTKNLKVINNYIYNNSEYGVLYSTDSTLELNGNTQSKTLELQNCLTHASLPNAASGSIKIQNQPL